MQRQYRIILTFLPHAYFSASFIVLLYVFSNSNIEISYSHVFSISAQKIIIRIGEISLGNYHKKNVLWRFLVGGNHTHSNVRLKKNLVLRLTINTCLRIFKFHYFRFLWLSLMISSYLRNYWSCF